MVTQKKLVTFRRADTGQFTTAKFAEKHPRTTVKETHKK